MSSPQDKDPSTLPGEDLAAAQSLPPARENYDISFETEDPAPDQVGVYPADVHVPPLEARRYLWTARAFAIALYISLAVNIVIAIALYLAWNYRTIEPMLVTFNAKEQQIARIEPFAKNMAGYQLMTELLVSEYVKIREEMVDDKQEMERRWNIYIANRMENQAFRRFYDPKSALYSEFQKNQLTRLVEVGTITQNASRRDLYEVDFTTADYDRNKNLIGSGKWRAYVTVRYVQRQVPYEERYTNPLGFQVVEYSVTRRE